MKENYEFCPRCDANLTLQKGYSCDLPYWICKGCGEMLINPSIDTNIAWVCDECEAMLNVQPGFDESLSEWTCCECGHINSLDSSDIYLSDDEYREELRYPYRGLSDSDALELALYSEIESIEGRGNIFAVKNIETDEKFIKKILKVYDKSIYEYLMKHSIAHMPRIHSIYESDNSLIVIEEFIEGDTIAKMLQDGPLEEVIAVDIALEVCKILDALHSLERPIIHRDIKPSNIIVAPNKEVYLLDMNVAKWYDAEKNDDTRHMGTQNYAAPEQVGFGLKASSAKSDIYGVGILLNVMTTNHYPKQQKSSGKLWDIIECCINLDADRRYNDSELIEALKNVREEIACN